MSFTCTNGSVHKHDLVYEARVCYGFVRPPAQPVRPFEVHELPVTDRQLRYIESLGGDTVHAAKLTKKAASDYIKRLLQGGSVSTAPSTPAAPAKRPVDPRLGLLTGLFDQVRDGYYATQVDGSAPIRFLRISTPKRGRTAISQAARKIQSQHGPRWEVAGALWPSGQWSIYDSRIIEQLMLVVTDQRGCLKRYSKELGHCCRCNTELTDERSRHYGIGPECEKHWPDVINEVDEENDGMPFEHLAR